MRFRKLRSQALLVAVVLVFSVPVGGIAYAYWSAYGAGVGAATAGTTTALMLTPGTVTANIYPGGAGPVTVLVSNPNTSAIHITSFYLDTTQGANGFGVDVGHFGCNASSLSFATQTNGGSGWTVPAKIGLTNGSMGISLSNAISMNASSSNSCQGATFTVYLATS